MIPHSLSLPAPHHDTSGTRRFTELPHRAHTTAVTPPLSLPGTVFSFERHRAKALQDVGSALADLRNRVGVIRDTRVYDITTGLLAEWSREVTGVIETIEDRLQDFVKSYQQGEPRREDATHSIIPEKPREPFPRSRTTQNPTGPRRASQIPIHPSRHPPAPKAKGTQQQAPQTCATQQDPQQQVQLLSGMTSEEATGLEHNGFSPHHLVSCSLHVALEAVAQQLRAERATVFQFIPRTDTLQGVAVAGSGSMRPGLIRTPAQSGIAGAVFQTGIALNVSNVYAFEGFDATIDQRTSYRTRAVLCFPLRSPQSRAVIGVVQALNKNRGTANFNADDELTLHQFTPLLAYIISRYSVDLIGHWFNPLQLHQLQPFEARGPDDGLPQLTMNGSVARVAQAAGATQLIYRTAHSGKLTRSAFATHGVPVGSAGPSFGAAASATLREVDEYIATLETCWKQAVTRNIEFEGEAEQQAAVIAFALEKAQKRKRDQKPTNSLFGASEEQDV
eukprot:TRINITY_DN27843_c0_g1_i1.p1 TRINITY_DN27843_c0_g1~~TRINITY_DN27843_c0_g1_i1.p1  ORF type:complete len:505 (+),score=67.04 TRINITY_DN27843_c0_g1_i1:24-1538(+)